MAANNTETREGPSALQRVVNHFREFGEWLAAGNWVYGAIAFLVIGALILPPISLPQRLHITGYTRLSAANPSVSHPDGLTVRVNPEDNVSLRVRLDSVPQAIFLQGSGGADLKEALATLPPVLQVKSPFYRIQTGSRMTGPATLEVVIPNDAEPWETLDLYTWTGTAWEWVGGTLDREREVLIAQVPRLPSSVVVMQTLPVVPAIGTVAAGEAVSGPAAGLLTQVMLPGLYLGTDGMLVGKPPARPSGSPEALLLVGNRPTGQPLNRALSRRLADKPRRPGPPHRRDALQSHGLRRGVALNYEGLMPEQKDAFSAFVAALADALHAQGLRLEVMVPAPSRTDSGWDPGGYDWAALGRAADALIFPLPDNPVAYAEGGAVQSLIEWAVGQVGRYKLRAAVSSLSADSGPDGVRYVGLEEALAPFGQVQPPTESSVQPGQEVVFALVGQVTSITPMESAGTYAITYKTEQGEGRTVWLGTPVLPGPETGLGPPLPPGRRRRPRPDERGEHARRRRGSGRVPGGGGPAAADRAGGRLESGRPADGGGAGHPEPAGVPLEGPGGGGDVHRLGGHRRGEPGVGAGERGRAHPDAHPHADARPGSRRSRCCDWSRPGLHASAVYCRRDRARRDEVQQQRDLQEDLAAAQQPAPATGPRTPS
jgi:hypothetical protein